MIETRDSPATAIETWDSEDWIDLRVWTPTIATEVGYMSKWALLRTMICSMTTKMVKLTLIVELKKLSKIAE